MPPCRVYVMGDRGVAREDATAEDRAEMARLAAEGIKAGALGFSTSRTINHRTVAGDYTPTLHAGEQELVEIAKAVGEVGEGWLQVITDFDDPKEEMATLRRMASESGRADDHYRAAARQPPRTLARDHGRYRQGPMPMASTSLARC